MRASAVIAILLGACAAKPMPDWQAMSADRRQATLDAIADDCRIARATFRFRASGELIIQPDSKVDFARLDCAVKKLNGVRGLGKMGFIGAEAAVEEKTK